MKYNHLTAEQRYTIDVLLRQKKSRKEIAQTIGVSESTLCRELKRNSGQRGYHWQQAHVKAADRQRRLQNYRNLTLEIRNFIRTKIIEEQWSPAQIVGYLRRKGEPSVCIKPFTPISVQTKRTEVSYGHTAAISSNTANVRYQRRIPPYRTEQ